MTILSPSGSPGGDTCGGKQGPPLDEALVHRMVLCEHLFLLDISFLINGIFILIAERKRCQIYPAEGAAQTQSPFECDHVTNPLLVDSE